MKTQEQKLQHVMEAAGECYHDIANKRWPNKIFCRLCKKDLVSNPLPDDLNELFRLADKIGYTTKKFKVEILTRIECFISSETGTLYYSYGYSDAEALLNALFIATGGKD